MIHDELYRKSGAERWGLSRDEFAAALEASVSDAVPLSALNLPDLALARACALGREAAWDAFVLTHRPVLYRAADALDPAGGAREIADALYADLYGLKEGADGRRSLFRYFHGRSTLATWLRSVLAQRYVDMVRARKRTESLEEHSETRGFRLQAEETRIDPDRARLVPLVVLALGAAIDALAAKDRLRLRSYYVSQLTLAAIGRITGEHEATVSRQLARTRQTLRAEMDKYLREVERLSPAQVRRALELAIEDSGALDLQHVLARKESPPDRSK